MKLTKSILKQLIQEELEDLPEEPPERAMFERKLTKSKLKQLIKEELKAVLTERISPCAKKYGEAAYSRVAENENAHNAKWVPLRDKLAKLAGDPIKSLPVRKALVNVWKEGWYTDMKETFDMAISDAACGQRYDVRRLIKVLNNIDKRFEIWLLETSGPLSPEQIDKELNCAINTALELHDPQPWRCFS
tara:strand:- start:6177 stop:6746 length:570 start_codon:yes stop_codon:yes gene_type:complete